jgi:hypothetical protein
VPLFDLAGVPQPFRRLNSSVDVYETEIETLFWDNLEAFTGEPLFPIARQPRLGSGGIPDLVALDPSGNVVVIEIKRDIDRGQLAQCLEYAGWARDANLQELATLYTAGPGRFFRDWPEFTATPTPVLLGRAPRLVLVARSFDDRTASALTYLEASRVPVKLIRVLFYEDPTGRRIADVDNGVTNVDATLTSEPRRPRGSSEPTPTSRASSQITVADLLDAELIQPAERIEWHRPQLDVRHQATIAPDGAIVVDGTAFPSPSGAASALAGNPQNGWECWTVPRLANLRLSGLRAQLAVSGPTLAE